MSSPPTRDSWKRLVASCLIRSTLRNTSWIRPAHSPMPRLSWSRPTNEARRPHPPHSPSTPPPPLPLQGLRAHRVRGAVGRMTLLTLQEVADHYGVDASTVR